MIWRHIKDCLITLRKRRNAHSSRNESNTTTVSMTSCHSKKNGTPTRWRFWLCSRQCIFLVCQIVSLDDGSFSFNRWNACSSKNRLFNCITSCQTSLLKTICYMDLPNFEHKMHPAVSINIEFKTPRVFWNIKVNTVIIRKDLDEYFKMKMNRKRYMQEPK